MSEDSATLLTRVNASRVNKLSSKEPIQNKKQVESKYANLRPESVLEGLKQSRTKYLTQIPDEPLPKGQKVATPLKPAIKDLPGQSE